MPTGSLSQSGPLVALETLPETLKPEGGKGFLINRNFALLAIGQAISNMGDFVYTTTLLVWVFTLTHSAAAISGVLLAQYAPVFLLGPVAGVFVDRWNRRTTMIVSDLIRAVATLLPFVVPEAATSSYNLYKCLSTFNVFSFFHAGADRVCCKSLYQRICSPRRHLSHKQLSHSPLSSALPRITALLCGGAVVACLINAVSFLVSALCLRFIVGPREAFIPYASAGTERRGGIRPVIRELLVGFRFVATTRVLLVVTFLALIAMLGAGALNALDIIFVSRNLHASTALYGPLTAAGGLGALIGAIAMGLSRKRWRRNIFWRAASSCWA